MSIGGPEILLEIMNVQAAVEAAAREEKGQELNEGNLVDGASKALDQPAEVLEGEQNSDKEK
ncbi:hypothetical protein A2Z41_00825 [Microgenomates group bacterium RBG_19FT_COMBO_39_10]|nr:MAG: hypothetical protein A2Z41_00825 [Microgenomates group bacterium RBG_19FT_COMBO_39_10]